MTDLKNIYDYLSKINFEKRIAEEAKFIRDRKNNPDFELMVCPFVMMQFVFSILQDFYEEIHKDIEEKGKKNGKNND